MQRSLSRFVLPLAIAVVAIYVGDGCVLIHDSCVAAPDVIYTNYPIVTLAQLTRPALGRNITSTTHEDRISVTIEPLPGGSQQMEIRLVAGPNVTWWKAVEIRRPERRRPECFLRGPGVRVDMLETQDERNTTTHTLVNSQTSDSSLVFWKAKALGVHTAMYQLSGNLGTLQGQRLTINWEVD